MKVSMINMRKVRLMTKLAIYEKKEGKEDIRLGTFFRRDYVRLKILQNIVIVTIGYLLVLGMIGAYQMEYLIKEAVTLDYVGIGRLILGIYVILITVYVMAVLVGYSLYYDYSRKKLSKYFRMLRLLRSFYEEEEIEE